MIDREVSYVVSVSSELTNALEKTPVKVGDIAGLLSGVVLKLQSLKRKVCKMMQGLYQEMYTAILYKENVWWC